MKKRLRSGAITILLVVSVIALIIAIHNSRSVAAIEGTALAYTQGDPATTITAGAEVSDVDSPNLVSMTVTVSANYVEDEDILAFPAMAGFTAVFNKATGELVVTGPNSPAAYTLAARNVTYQNVASDPSTATRTISFVFFDGTSNSNTITRNITISTGGYRTSSYAGNDLTRIQAAIDAARDDPDLADKVAILDEGTYSISGRIHLGGSAYDDITVQGISQAATTIEASDTFTGFNDLIRVDGSSTSIDNVTFRHMTLDGRFDDNAELINGITYFSGASTRPTNCKVEFVTSKNFGKSAFFLEGSGTADNCTALDSEAHGFAIDCNGSTDTTWNLTHGGRTGMSQYGIDCAGSDGLGGDTTATVTNFTFNGNTAGGGKIAQNTNDDGISVSFTNGSFDMNSGAGFLLTTSGATSFANTSFSCTDVTINNNTGNGISMSYDFDRTFLRTEINSNGGIGLNVQGGSTSTTFLTDCEVNNNVLDGIRFGQVVAVRTEIKNNALNTGSAHGDIFSTIGGSSEVSSFTDCVISSSTITKPYIMKCFDSTINFDGGTITRGNATLIMGIWNSGTVRITLNPDFPSGTKFVESGSSHLASTGDDTALVDP